MTKPKTAIGLMSGTSMDGIDAALVRTDGQKHLEIIGHYHYAYPAAFRQRLKAGMADAEQIINRQDRPGNLERLEEDLTHQHAGVVADLLAKLEYERAGVDLIGFHGQTLIHRPQQHMTVQIGNGALLAEKTGIDVIHDMRARDMEHGGQGAPLTPVYHAALAERLRGREAFPLAFVNIGGIANLTWVDEQGQISAFDCGPGNCLIDQWIETHTGKNFDCDGKAGLRGQIIVPIVQRYLDLAWWNRADRSFDWRDFAPLGKNSAELHDGAATLAHITAASIIHSLKHRAGETRTLIISGGGVKNRMIMQQLHALATPAGIAVLTADAAGFNAGFIEAEAWGYLAVRSFYHLPLTYPATTGCAVPVSGGILAQALGAQLG